MTAASASEASSGSPKPQERRVFPRRGARGLALYRPANRPFNPAVRARLVDIAPDGIGGVSPEPLAVATAVEVELEAAAGSYRLVRQAEIRWVTAQPDGQFRFGCCFAQRLTFAQMQSYL
jgi:hypothetical protein